MSLPQGDTSATPKAPGIFTFSTTVSQSAPVAIPEAEPCPEPKIMSPTKEILPMFFFYLERYQFSEASKVLSLAGKSNNKVWALFPPLQLLTACECIYHSLVWLEVWNSNASLSILDMMYTEISNTIEQLVKGWAQKGDTSRPKIADSAVSYLSTLMAEIEKFVAYRQKLVSIRMNLHKNVFEATRTMLEEGLQKLAIVAEFPAHISHQLLLQLAQNMATEVDIYKKLLTVELNIINFNVNAAIFWFYSADLELQSCNTKLSFVKDNTESSEFMSTALYKWYVSFRDHLFAKMQLYFQDFRSKHPTPVQSDPFKSGLGAELRLHEMIVEFVAQTSCFNVSLVLKPTEDQQNGLSSWVPVYTFPQKSAPIIHWPNIISLYQDNSQMLAKPLVVSSTSTSEKSLLDRHRPDDIPLPIIHYYDTGVKTTYFISKLQSKVLLVLIFEGMEKEEDDSQAISFIKRLYAKLRYSQMLHNVLVSQHTSNPGSPSPTPPIVASGSSSP